MSAAKKIHPLVGKRFHASYADCNVEYEVKRQRGRGVFECVATANNPDYVGKVSLFSESDVSASVEHGEFFKRLIRSHADFYNSLEPGQIVHYDNGFGQYVRCEVVDHEGKHDTGAFRQLKPLALVGNWREYDLPSRASDGSIIERYHSKMIRTGELFEPNYTNIFESPDYTHKKEGRPDPKDMAPISLEVPDMTPAEQERASLETLRTRVAAILQNEKDLKLALALAKEALNA